MWRETRSRVWRFYCPHCSAERKINMGSRPDSPLRYFQVGLSTAVLMITTWPWFGWKGFVLFLPLWIAFEVYFRVRLRALAPCPRCGFDPYLYLTDIDRARGAIEAHWRKKFEERGVPYPDPKASAESPDVEASAPKRPPRAINAKQHAGTNPQ